MKTQKKELPRYQPAKIASKWVSSVLSMADEAGETITSISVTVGLSDKRSSSRGDFISMSQSPVQL
jgi:sulfate adenylyltransferase subunit 1 (EFTu-like GTPase family)